MRVSIIDLGSNAIRMYIAEIIGSKTKVLERYRENVRLSENMSQTMMLQPEPISRTIKAAEQFMVYSKEYGVEKIVAVATAAMRMAKNKEEIIEPLKKMGIDLKIIDGLQEARYDFLGVMYSSDIETCVIVDIGGASTEIIAVKDREVVGNISIPFGAVSITENYIKDYDCIGCTDEAYSFVTEKLKEVEFLDLATGFPMVALGGTARAFGRIDSGKEDIDGVYKLNANRTKEIINLVNNMTLQEIQKNVTIEKKRSDIIKGGFVIAKCVIERICAEEVIVSRSGIREGILYELAN